MKQLPPDPLLNRRYSLPTTGFFAFVCVYMIVTLATGFNFLAVVAVAIALSAALFVLIEVIFLRRANLWLLLSYLVTMGGLLLFYLIRGADPFGRRLWYNLVLTALPIAIAVLLLFGDKLFDPKRINARVRFALPVLLTVTMLGSTVMYFLAMSIRVRPTVVSLQKGHDDYLRSVEAAKQAGSPNVLVILMDDMAYADLSCYSYLGNRNATIQTPNIDSIGDQGILMTDFYSASPVCSPSRFSMLTGRYPSRGYLDNVVFPTAVSFAPFGSTRYFNPFQFLNNVDGILGDEITLAEVLQAGGYRTGLIGKWNLGDYGEYLPTNQGFDYFYGSYYVNDMTPYNMVREIDGKATEVHSHADLKDQSETTRILSEELDRFISDSADAGNPFFAYYCTPWPHYPIFSGVKGDTTDDSYIDCIEEFDAYLGKTFDLMRQKGIFDDTLIIFTSDNGPGREGVTGALRGRKNTTFDGGHKVPLLACYVNGGLGQGAALGDTNVIATPSMNFDLFPTILSYCGIDRLPDDRVIDGKNLYDIWQGNVSPETRVHDALYFIKGGKVQGVQMPLPLDGTVSDFKYYEKVRTENSAFIDQVYKNYLFNLTLDPAEGYNVSMKYPEIADTMLRRLHAFRKELKANRRGISPAYYGD